MSVDARLRFMGSETHASPTTQLKYDLTDEFNGVPSITRIQKVVVVDVNNAEQDYYNVSTTDWTVSGNKASLYVVTQASNSYTALTLRVYDGGRVYFEGGFGRQVSVTQGDQLDIGVELTVTLTPSTLQFPDAQVDYSSFAGDILNRLINGGTGYRFTRLELVDVNNNVYTATVSCSGDVTSYKVTATATWTPSTDVQVVKYSYVVTDSTGREVSRITYTLSKPRLFKAGTQYTFTQTIQL